MTVECFLDKNILVYAAAGKNTAETKRRLANELIAGTEFATSAQKLQEFYSVVTRKIKILMSPANALEWIETVAINPCVAIDATLVKSGIEISERCQISYWDGAILAAAESLNIPILYTEDLNHEQHYGTVQVINPFAHVNL